MSDRSANGILWHALGLLLLGSLVPPATAGEVLRANPAAAVPRSVAKVPSAITGQVLTSEGLPAAGAVVVTSAGGRAVTAADGTFRLEVGLAEGALTVHVTAVRGGGKAASVPVAIDYPGAPISAGLLTLQEDASIQPAWIPTFGGQPGVGIQSFNSETIYAVASYDDGSGPALYVTGDFTTAGGVQPNRIAKWDGQRWSALGDGLAGTAPNALVGRALAVFDDGTGNGPELYVGGDFTTAGGVTAKRIAKWNGTTWSPVGGGFDKAVHALAVYDDGNGGGPALYAGGEFTIEAGPGGTSPLRSLARWDGVSWTKVKKTGFVQPLTGTVRALAVHDDGSGPSLYLGGSFTVSFFPATNNVVEWDGQDWQSLSTGMNDDVYALASFDDGLGARLYAGGKFGLAGGTPVTYIASWDGASWSAVGAPLDRFVLALEVFDDGGGSALYAGGKFDFAGALPVVGIGKWDGAAWSALGTGVTGGNDPDVWALAVHDDGSGAKLVVGGGDFDCAGGVGGPCNGGVPVRRIATWDGTDWGSVGSGLSGAVRALETYDDGSGGGPSLYAGGSFTAAGGDPARYVVEWAGGAWHALGTGLSGDNSLPGAVAALLVHDDGSGNGPQLYAGGSFTSAGGSPANRIARWDGHHWSNLGGGMSLEPGSIVSALAVFDDGSGGGPELYAAGAFAEADGHLANGIAKWDGAAWSSLERGVDGDVRSLATFDDGTGEALYVGGVFSTAGQVTANNIAKWDGTNWSALGSGVSVAVASGVNALSVFDDGSGGGGGLFAGGNLLTAGGMPVLSIAKWDGSAWSAAASPVNFGMSAMRVFDDGTGGGPALYAGGYFTTAGGVAVSEIARWDGVNWTPLGSGVAGGVSAFEVHDDGTGGGPALFVGGSFYSAPDSGDSFLAKWGGGSSYESYCTAGITANGCTALLSAAGAPSASAPSGFDLEAAGVEGDKDGLFFFAANGRQANSWGNGTSFQCVAPPVKRSALLSGTGTSGACDGTFSDDLNARWTAKPNQNPGAGAIVQAQLWFRDPGNTSNQTTSLSDAIEFTVQP